MLLRQNTEWWRFLHRILKKEITKILKGKGYILNYKFEDEVNSQGNIKIALKYQPETEGTRQLKR